MRHLPNTCILRDRPVGIFETPDNPVPGDRADIARTITRALCNGEDVFAPRHMTANQVILRIRRHSDTRAGRTILALDRDAQIATGYLPCPDEVGVARRKRRLGRDQD